MKCISMTLCFLIEFIFLAIILLDLSFLYIINFPSKMNLGIFIKSIIISYQPFLRTCFLKYIMKFNFQKICIRNVECSSLHAYFFFHISSISSSTSRDRCYIRVVNWRRWKDNGSFQGCLVLLTILYLFVVSFSFWSK